VTVPVTSLFPPGGTVVGIWEERRTAPKAADGDWMTTPPEPPQRSRERKQTFGLEIEALMKKLPAADPYLKGTPLGTKTTSGTMPRARASLVRPNYVSPETSVPAMRAQGAQIDTALMWIIVASSVGLGAALTQWPYASSCGWSLGFYLAALGAQMVVSGWGALATWRVANAYGHVLSLIALFWGIVLAAEQILPRVGYAATEAVWRCAG
jgi:hypothetical protein